MIGAQVFRHIPTTLDLNGPILSLSSLTGTGSTISGGEVSFIGLATATFPSQTPTNPAVPDGTLTYQWYEVGVGALSDGTNISGSATTTLTISNVISPDDNGREFYLRNAYTPSAYGVGKSTPNALNEPLDSGIVTIGVDPFITITSEPGISTVAQGQSATFSIGATVSDGTLGDLSYAWTQDGTAISGQTSSTLSISDTTVGVTTIQGSVSHPSASNSPVYTTAVNYDVVSARQILNVEVLDSTPSLYSTQSRNLYDETFNYTADPSIWTRVLSLYAPERDINVKITLGAGAGRELVGNRGGHGGMSIFNLTLAQDTEYIVKLGALTAPSGGSNGGGGGAFFYRKGTLLVAVGGGGGAGSNGRGGDGGGVAIAGENGTGSNPGLGGGLFSEGSLPVAGFFAGGSYSGGVNYSSLTGGRLSACTIGNYYATQGFSPCSDVGNVKFRGGEGGIASGTATIQRGYKSGLAHRNNGGNGEGNNGGGGGGTVGGNAGSSGGSGGGGASGYSNGEVTIVTTQLGGNTSTNAYITIEKQS